ncbi:hypothetical protein OMP43_16955 [Sphingomonas sp. CBMAI 2297]|uniref:hypothetical protein n=1 Tax=Sphingomonas sp. CBMAI 2297 TaxID=2991720 RepID=UPI0024573935|nr:hypothetical protein [Sphingomonas sp. CBMAI 2297]MDH4745716.1 hypothetical protein [Sphingomonas sp. CBMAI 2297]
MRGRGRPLRFLAMVTIAWVGVRAALLWPRAGSPPAAIEAAAPGAGAGPVAVTAAVAPPPSPLPAPTRRERPPSGKRQPVPGYRAPLGEEHPRVQLALMALAQYGAVPPALRLAQPMPRAPAPGPTAPGAPERLDPLPDRWSLSLWMVARGEGGMGAAPGGQIGGGQAGARVAWRISPRDRIAAYGRVTAPLRGRGREAALGLEWQPSRAPVRLVVERRFGLDGNPGGTGLGTIAGIDAEWKGFRLEAYGQAGAVLRQRADPYADGAARGTRAIGASGPVRFALGAGAWGAAQRDAQRLDIGPSATLAVRNLRLALDWRQRVAGEARPGSGLALTLGADF